MISLLDVGPPSIVFLTLYFSVMTVVTYRYYTEPVNPYCIRKDRPSDCGENRSNYITTLILLTLSALLWTWILNIVYQIGFVFFAWFLVFIPCVVSLVWFAYDFIPKTYLTWPSIPPSQPSEVKQVILPTFTY